MNKLEALRTIYGLILSSCDAGGKPCLNLQFFKIFQCAFLALFLAVPAIATEDPPPPSDNSGSDGPTAEGEDCESDEDCPEGYICSMGHDGYPEEPPHEDTDDAEDTEDGPGVDDGAGSSGGSDGSSHGATGTCIPDPSCDENEDCMDHEFFVT